MLTGASLAIAGAGMQGIFRNPLADPSITGVSSGAALGAVLAITWGLPFWGMQIGALACGLSAFAAVCILGRLEGRLNALSMLLAGIAVNAFCGALVGYCMYNAREGGLKSFVFWSLGSLDAADWNGIILCACFAIPAWIILLLSHRGLDLMSLGAEQAFNSGVNVKRLWYATAFAASAATAACVAISGVIGFVGLVVPHMMRMLCGAENKKLLPLSAIAGANLLVASDLISRLLSPSDAVPIGVITALTGVPFFMFLLARNKRRENA